MNFKLFPANISKNNEKRPLIKNWQAESSNDINLLNFWRKKFGVNLNTWGIPCGPINNIYVIDIDVKNGKNGWLSAKTKGLNFPPTLTQVTRTGGSHLFYELPSHLDLKNTVEKIAAGIDTRGTGGWVAYYGFNEIRSMSELPSWVVQYTERNFENKSFEFSTAPISCLDYKEHQFAQFKIKQIFLNLKNARLGNRNNVLFCTSIEAGKLIATYGVPESELKLLLLSVAINIGLSRSEALQTMNSGILNGKKNPYWNIFK